MEKATAEVEQGGSLTNIHSTSTHDIPHPNEIKKEGSLSSEPRTHDGLMEHTVVKYEDIGMQGLNRLIKSDTPVFEELHLKSEYDQAATNLTTKTLTCDEKDFHEEAGGKLRSEMQKLIAAQDMPKPFFTTQILQQPADNLSDVKAVKTLEGSIQDNLKSRVGQTFFNKFSSNSTVKKHTKAHTEEKPFECNVCHYKCTKRNTLKVHAKIHSGEKPFKCSACDYRCIRKDTLKQHMKTHTGEKRFQCTVCDYKFAKKSNLEAHARIHTGEKPFKCSACDYRCTQKSTLKGHMRAHTEEQPFKCSVCEYKCKWKSSLLEHLNTHTGEKPFKCSTCDYRCTRNRSLKEHMQTHTGEKPFKCNSCDYRCTLKGNLKKHVIIHTSEKRFKC